MFGDTQDIGEMYDGCGDGGRMVRLLGGVVVSGWFDRKCLLQFLWGKLFEKEPHEGQRIEKFYVLLTMHLGIILFNLLAPELCF